MNTALIVKDKRGLVIGCLVAACGWRLEMQDDLCISGQTLLMRREVQVAARVRPEKHGKQMSWTHFILWKAIGCITGVHAGLERSNIQSTTPLFFTV